VVAKPYWRHWEEAKVIDGDLFHLLGCLARAWPSRGVHAWVQPATYGKGRLLIGPIGSLVADHTY
jgi:hypothetical protein